MGINEGHYLQKSPKFRMAKGWTHSPTRRLDCSSGSPAPTACQKMLETTAGKNSIEKNFEDDMNFYFLNF